MQTGSQKKNYVFTFSSVASEPTRVSLFTQDLCGLISVPTTSYAASTNASMQPFFNAIRIKKLRMWQPLTSLNSAPAGVLQPSTIGCFWMASNDASFCPEWQLRKTISATQVAYLESTPPKNSQASFWNPSSASQPICKLQFDQAAVISVELEATMGFGGGLSNTTQYIANTYTVPSVANALLGGVPYQMPLDFASSGYGSGNTWLLSLAEGTIF